MGLRLRLCSDPWKGPEVIYLVSQLGLEFFVADGFGQFGVLSVGTYISELVVERVELLETFVDFVASGVEDPKET